VPLPFPGIVCVSVDYFCSVVHGDYGVGSGFIRPHKFKRSGFTEFGIEESYFEFFFCGHKPSKSLMWVLP
jgi:hypothetical protein